MVGDLVGDLVGDFPGDYPGDFPGDFPGDLVGDVRDRRAVRPAEDDVEVGRCEGKLEPQAVGFESDGGSWRAGIATCVINALDAAAPRFDLAGAEDRPATVNPPAMVGRLWVGGKWGRLRDGAGEAEADGHVPVVWVGAVAVRGPQSGRAAVPMAAAEAPA